MKKLLIISALMIPFMVGGVVYAANKAELGSTSAKAVEKSEIKVVGQGLQNSDSVTTKVINREANGEGVEEQNRVQRGLPEGARENRQVGVQDKGLVGEEVKDRGSDKSKGLENAVQRRSEVANAVQEMLKVADRNGGIGQEVRVIAQAQNETQEQAEKSLEKVQSRSNFAKFFIGLNNKEIKNAKEYLNQNKEQIKNLIELKNKIVNSVDKTMLEEQISVLEKAYSDIQNNLDQTKNKFSLLGWLF